MQAYWSKTGRPVLIEGATFHTMLGTLENLWIQKLLHKQTDTVQDFIKNENFLKERQKEVSNILILILISGKAHIINL